jgi:hypothetical protein
LAAEKTNTRMQALMMCGRPGMFFMAATKGEAAAEFDALVAKARSSELYGTSIPTRRTLRT